MKKKSHFSLLSILAQLAKKMKILATLTGYRKWWEYNFHLDLQSMISYFIPSMVSRSIGAFPHLRKAWLMIMWIHFRVMSSFCVGIVVIVFDSTVRIFSDIFLVRFSFRSIPGSLTAIVTPEFLKEDLKSNSNKKRTKSVLHPHSKHRVIFLLL